MNFATPFADPSLASPASAKRCLNYLCAGLTAKLLVQLLGPSSFPFKPETNQKKKHFLIKALWQEGCNTGSHYCSASSSPLHLVVTSTEWRLKKQTINWCHNGCLFRISLSSFLWVTNANLRSPLYFVWEAVTKSRFYWSPEMLFQPCTKWVKNTTE